jgi:ribosomal protein L37AE/L43A
MILLTTLLIRPHCRLTTKALESVNRQEEVVPMEGSTTARFHSIRCPFCEVYELERLRDGSAHCALCGGSLDAELLSMIWQIRTLPEALGSHPCEECGHPEMRRLPDGVFHCSACGAEVLPAYGSAQSGGSKGVSEAYLSGWMDGLFGRSASFVHNRELARWEVSSDRLDYYRGHHAGREAFLDSVVPREAFAGGGCRWSSPVPACE